MMPPVPSPACWIWGSSRTCSPAHWSASSPSAWCGGYAPNAPPPHRASLSTEPDPRPSAEKIAVGCAACRQTGYRGRLGIFELLLVDDIVRRQIQARATAAEINTAVRAAGMHTLRDDGIAKTAAGLTSMEDVLRVTMRLEQGAQ